MLSILPYTNFYLQLLLWSRKNKTNGTKKEQQTKQNPKLFLKYSNNIETKFMKCSNILRKAFYL